MVVKGGFPGGSVVKNPPANAGDPGDVGLIPESGRSPGVGNGNPLEYSVWRIPWTEEPGGLQSIGSQRAGREWATVHTLRSWLPHLLCTHRPRPSVEDFPTLSSVNLPSKPVRCFFSFGYYLHLSVLKPRQGVTHHRCLKTACGGRKKEEALCQTFFPQRFSCLVFMKYSLLKRKAFLTHFRILTLKHQGHLG